MKKKDFVWGVATAATQIEGAAYQDDKSATVWDVMSEDGGYIANNHKVCNADDSYNRFDEDLKLLKELGWTFIPLMEIGKGCQAHLKANEIPMNDTIICRVSKHLVCVKNGVLNDTYNCSRGGTRCVYGYYIKK